MRVALFVLLSIICASAGATEAVLTAIPRSRVAVGPDGAEREELSESERTKALLVIQRDGDKYTWATRENRELIRIRSGVFVFFLDPRSASYIKIVTDKSISASLDESCADGFPYFEHVSLGLTTLTYWGCAAELNL